MVHRTREQASTPIGQASSSQLHHFQDGDETITVKTQELFSGEYLAWDMDRPLLASGRGFSTIGAIADLFEKLPRAASEREERDDLATRFDHARDLRKHEVM